MQHATFTPHGGYRELKSFQNATIVYDFTFQFCKRYLDDYRLRDQMVHAARSGRQNIAEGCQVSGTSKSGEMKLVSVARASLEELLCDYEDFLRQRDWNRWDRHDDRVADVCALAYAENRSYKTYETYISSVEVAANTAICIIHQTNFLLDRQLNSLLRTFQNKGGLREQLYQIRATK